MFRKSLTIELVEPVVYLRGHPKDKHTINILRGLIRLQLSHPAIIQSVTIQFIGTAKTLWPEASHHWDKHVLVDSIIPICRSPVVLKKGVHAFPFEILLSNALSESVECGLGHVRYKLLCQVHIKPAWSPFGSQLKAQRAVVLVRLPQQDSVPRCISQTHTLKTHSRSNTSDSSNNSSSRCNDICSSSTNYSNSNNSNNNEELHVLVESAHITPGTPLALCFSFSHAPSTINDLSVKLIERQKFRARAKRTTRILHHEITLAPSDPDLLKHQLRHANKTTELRCVFAVPDKETLQVHPSTSNPNIRVRHWIQITLRFTLQDGTPKEILMDAPISVLMDCIDDYITLPVYHQHAPPTPQPSERDLSAAASTSSSSLLPSPQSQQQPVASASAPLLGPQPPPVPTPSKSWLNRLTPRRSWLSSRTYYYYYYYYRHLAVWSVCARVVVVWMWGT
ncbi:hypothetical protein BDB00DRAFT_828481 [Zychaea mexicana]|uniref:uncharacterized protein n=1 Tax=Zychaea mexicana TaxID=64656 RepID=UPI0022FECF9A|nr:uncharacterized protein BDB00DRAFT_828481 [Zychaea mexicana]KAI9492496.1 hypothetical protein BDB00DRAFT_828481 [Zychaea mexicana]